ncbi:MAG: hypothetical protein H0V25_09415 [Solirubrobacterales bacterium]|nr:hypothetical protein [Solirubrobacterales bacterium]
MATARTELESSEEILSHLDERGDLRGVVVQGVDLRGVAIDWDVVPVAGSVFLACLFADGDAALAVQERGAVVVPDLSEERPYLVYPSGLYTYEDLTGGGADEAIQRWVIAHPDPMEPVESIAQRLHDTAMTDATFELIRPEGGEPRRVVGIMGGHAVLRDAPEYEAVVRLGYGLTEAGFFVVTGGGPGAMEAGNLGAFLTRAGTADTVVDAVATLATAPTVEHPGYGDAAEEVHRRYAGSGQGGESLAIPTWLYGHEPIGRFATHIAKYFANSIREDGLLQIADEGVVFAPGGPGTIQEIFQDAAIKPTRRPRIVPRWSSSAATSIQRTGSMKSPAPRPPGRSRPTTTCWR